MAGGNGEHGEYRTKRLILEIYDEMAEAMSSRWETLSDPSGSASRRSSSGAPSLTRSSPMAFRMNLWAVDDSMLSELATSDLDLEGRLEDWLAHDPGMLGFDLLIVGRQVHSAHGGFIDLLAMDADANTYVLELKRAKTPRDVVAQVLDYASWVKDLTYAELEAICTQYSTERLWQRPLAEHFGIVPS